MQRKVKLAKETANDVWVKKKHRRQYFHRRKERSISRKEKKSPKPLNDHDRSCEEERTSQIR